VADREVGPVETIVVVQRDPNVRERYAGWLRAAGYEVTTCGGPVEPDFFCPVLKHCGCMESENTDAMVYDPCLVSQEGHPASERIIYRLREFYPGKPIVLIDCGEVGAKLAHLAEEDPGIVILGDPSPTSLVEHLRRALSTVEAAAS
jgi:hypothetical protein